MALVEVLVEIRVEVVAAVAFVHASVVAAQRDVLLAAPLVVRPDVVVRLPLLIAADALRKPKRLHSEFGCQTWCRKKLHTKLPSTNKSHRVTLTL